MNENLKLIADSLLAGMGSLMILSVILLWLAGAYFVFNAFKNMNK